MKILVTGGAGFIGSHTVDKLIEKNHTVSVIDNLSTGKEQNINKKARFYKADITDLQKIQEIFGKERPEIVYHLAAQISVRVSVDKPLQDAETNILASMNLIHCAERNAVKNFVFASSGGAIYGDTEDRYVHEDTPEYPVSPYGICKLTIDRYLHYYAKQFNFHSISLRYGNVYGPRQNAGGESGIIGILINNSLNNKPVIINGTGIQTRDYIYIDDVVNANIKALDYKNSTDSLHQIFNIGTGKETTINTLLEVITSVATKEVNWSYGPKKPGEQIRNCLDTTKAEKELKWKQKIELTDGIKKTYDWFQNNSHMPHYKSRP